MFSLLSAAQGKIVSLVMSVNVSSLVHVLLILHLVDLFPHSLSALPSQSASSQAKKGWSPTSTGFEQSNEVHGCSSRLFSSNHL